MLPRLVRVSLAITALACKADLTTAPGPAGLSFTMAVSRPAIRGGEADTILVTTANRSADSMTIAFGQGCQVLPYIRDGMGRTMLPPGGDWGCTAVVSELRLGPGEARQTRFVWTGSTAFASEMPLVPLPPGTYYVSATLAASSFQRRAGPVAVKLTP